MSIDLVLYMVLGEQNANLNSENPLRAGDLFSWLRDIVPTGQRFDVVISTRPADARSREIDYALKRYFDMNKLAMQAVARAESS